MNRVHRSAAAMALLLAVAGCAADRSYGSASNITITNLTALPAPKQVEDSRIAPRDSLEIKVLQYSDVNGTYVVGADGSLDFPLVGTIAADTLSPAQLAAEIARRLSPRYVLNPEVSVRSMSVTPLNLSIGGEVKSPGPYPVTTSPTLLRAINQAGGRTEYAKLNDVLIIREVDGQRYIGLYDLGAIERGNAPDPELAANDIVMVGDSPARRRLNAILKAVPLLSTTAILIDRIGN